MKIARRQALTAMIAAGVVSASSTAPAAADDPVIALWRAWRPLEDEYTRLRNRAWIGYEENVTALDATEDEQGGNRGDPEISARIDRLTQRTDALARRIRETPVGTVAGWAAKIDVALADIAGDLYPDDAAGAALMAVLRDMAPHLPPDMARRVAWLPDFHGGGVGT